MVACRLALFTVCLVAVSTPSACGGDLFHALVSDFQEVNQWPCPYVCWDRAAVEAPFPTMIQNGWRRQNLLADYHFSGTEGGLTPAGQFKVRWILTQVPLEHRTIFVQRAGTAEQTAARVAAIREYAGKAAPESGPPSVLETYMTPVGYSAGWPGGSKEDSSINRKFQPFVPEKIFLPDRKTSSDN